MQVQQTLDEGEWLALKALFRDCNVQGDLASINSLRWSETPVSEIYARAYRVVED